MMHSRLEETIAVEAGPEPHGPKPRCVWQTLGRKIDGRFFGHQIDVGENRDPGPVMFEDLSAPARLCTRVVSLSPLKSKPEQKLDQICKKSARTPEGVMVMVAPPKSKRVLAPLLDLSCVVAQFPVGAFLREEEFACDVRPDEINRLVLNLKRVGYALGIIEKVPFSGSPPFAHPYNCLRAPRNWRMNDQTPVAETFHREKPVTCILRNQCLP
jgi:hypothetical protein